MGCGRVSWVTGVVGLSGSEVGEKEKQKEDNGLGGKEGK